MDQLIRWRRDLHRHAESAWEEFYTTALIHRHFQTLANQGQPLRLTLLSSRVKERAVTLMGAPNEEKIKQAKNRAAGWGVTQEELEVIGSVTGLWADLFFGEGPTVALRFDIDAVKVEECRQPDHRPAAEGFDALTQAACHACGHDGHTALGLGLASAIANRAPNWHGTVRLIFQPAEEGVMGGKAMVDAGACEGVSRFFALHLGLGLPLGSLRAGTHGFLTTTKFDLRFLGKPAHAGGAPQEGKNALLAAATATLGLHGIAPHGQGATRLNVGRLNAGSGRNVIPAEARMECEVRGADEELESYARQRAFEIAKGAAAMQGVNLKIDLMGRSIGGKSDDELITLVLSRAKEMDCFTDLAPDRLMSGSDDAAWYMNEVQKSGGLATYIGLGASNRAGHHDGRFDFDEACLGQGVELLYRCLDSLLRRPGEL